MDRDERISIVTEHMEKLVGCTAKVVNDELWPSMIGLTEGNDTHRPFGYTTPQYLSYDDNWVVFYNPGAVVDAVSNLDEDLFTGWLRYMQAHIQGHLTETEGEEHVDQSVFLVVPQLRTIVSQVFDVMFT